MTREPTTDADADVSGTGDPFPASRSRDAAFGDRATPVLATGLFALAAVAANTAVRVLANLPLEPVVVSPTVRAMTAVLTPFAVAVALATVALSDRRATVRVGLLFAGVFGCIGLVAPGATLTAVVAVVGGGALALVGTLGVPERWTYRAVRRRAIAAGFVLAVAVSLASAVGILAGGRGVGSLLALASLAAVGTRSESSLPAVVAGLVAALGLVSVSATSPFVVGSALLVAFAVTGVPHALVALAAGGGVAAAVAGLGRRTYAPAVGACLLLLAGVPVTLPRAMAVLLGASLFSLDVTAPPSEVPS